ncbi:MAG TPA: MarC family NAAT transporter [Gammaproteobacteria bacterium]|nr:MarC family NAAT transporter [Gammaproteobacteria bacterium]
MSFFLLAFPALFSIVNPLGGAFIFLGATEKLGAKTRKELAKWIAIYSFAIVTASMYVGAYVLTFFGISIPVLRAAGGIVIAAAAWRMLNAPDDEEPKTTAEDVAQDLPATRKVSRMAFYPLTMPITTGPGTISVAVSLGANRPRAGTSELLSFVGQSMVAILLICALVYFLYRYSAPLSRLIGPTGTVIVTRLSAFLLFCIGVQVLWNGVSELIATVGL